MTKKFILSRIKRNPKTKCWEWTKCTTGNGYPQATINAIKNIAVHRLSFTLFNGPIPKGKHVLHKCDNKKCVNPKHLYLGTSVENNKDESIRGDHKISNEDVVKLRRLRENGMTEVALAEKFGISRWYTRNIISRILRRYI